MVNTSQHTKNNILLCSLDPHNLKILRPIINQFPIQDFDNLEENDLTELLINGKYQICFIQKDHVEMRVLESLDLNLLSTKIIILSSKLEHLQVVRLFRKGICDIFTLPLSENDCSQRLTYYLGESTNLGTSSKTITNIGHYQLIEEIGQGGMGTIYSAVDQDLGIEVALKVLKTEFMHDPKYIKQFEKEVSLLSQVMHKNIVAFFDYHQMDDRIFLSMERLNGSMLFEKEWSTEETLDIGIQISKALSALHALNIIHLDIKPDNIMITEDLNAKIIDFGIAKNLGEEKSENDKSNEIIASPLYSAPEVFIKKEDFFSDQYSLGCTLFEVLAKESPFPNNYDVDSLYKDKKRKAPNIKDFSQDISAAIANVIQKMMDPKKKHRFASMDDVTDALETLLEDLKADPMHWVLNDSDSVDLSNSDDDWLYEDEEDELIQEHTMGIDLDDILVIDSDNNSEDQSTLALPFAELPPTMLPNQTITQEQRNTSNRETLQMYIPVNIEEQHPPFEISNDQDDALNPFELDDFLSDMEENTEIKTNPLQTHEMNSKTLKK